MKANAKVSLVGTAGLALCVYISFPVLAPCQGTLPATQAPIQASEQSASIHGVVLNANTKQPIARALVQAGQHSLLTGHDGKFEFSGLSGSTVSVRVNKPGFYDGLDPNQTATKSVAVGSPDESQIRLYPEALITGTVTAANGNPLPQISVQALRRMNDESGSRWILGAQTTSNADGQFRLPLPGGQYVVETQYYQERQGGAGGVRGAILPVMAPAAGSSGGAGAGGAGIGASTIHLASGSEQRLELRPTVRQSHAVHIQVDSVDAAPGGQSAPQIQAHLANGMVFSPGTRGAEKQGEVVINLPNGSYLLSATAGGQNEGASYGETKVTVADEDVTGVAIHLQKAAELTIEASPDAASGAGTPSSSIGITDPSTATDPSASLVRQIGISLQRTDGGVSLRSDNISPTTHHGGPLSFSLLPGRYRLRATSYSAWFVSSANAGGTDLLTQEFVVNGGSSSQPLRLVVSNQTATVKGTVRIGETLNAGYVYLIATTPSLTPVLSVRAGSDGSFSRMSIPPGSYRAVASDTRLYFDLTDAAIQKQLGPYVKTVTVEAGETGTVDLDALPVSELKL